MSALFPLRLRGAEVRRRGRVVLGPVDLDLDDVGTCAVIGPNGSGKTTLLRAMHGLSRLSAGGIRWACADQDARRAQAFVFQRPVLLRRTVLDNIAYPLLQRGQTRTRARTEAAHWAARVGLAGLEDHPAHLVSGGEQQKLAIARALITRPGLLLLDEPCASLDGRATREIETILHAAQAGGTSIMLATHDMGQARRLASQVVFMLHGKVHETGQAQAFFHAPQTAEARAFLLGDIVE